MLTQCLFLLSWAPDKDPEPGGACPASRPRAARVRGRGLSPTGAALGGQGGPTGQQAREVQVPGRGVQEGLQGEDDPVYF